MAVETAVVRVQLDEDHLSRSVGRAVAEHRDHILADAVRQAAQTLRGHAQAIVDSGGSNADPLSEALWERLSLHDDCVSVVCGDPRTIAQIAYEVCADLIAAVADA